VYKLPKLSATVGVEYGGTADFSSEAPRQYTDALVSLHWLRVPERI